MDALRSAVNTLVARYTEAEADAIRSPGDLPWRSPEDMWHSAILRHWATALAEASPKDCALNNDTLAVIGQQLSDTVTNVFEALNAGLAQATEHDDGLRERLQATRTRLADLSARAGLPSEPGSPIRPLPELYGQPPNGELLRAWSPDPPTAPLEKALKTAQSIEQQDDLQLQEKTIEAARELIESLLTTIDAGGKLRLASGSAVGINTGTLSTGLQNAGHALAIPVSAQADFHASRKRQTVVEFGRGAHGRDLFIGTDKAVHASAGFGAAIGYDFRVLANRVRASLGLSVVPIDVERGKRVGVIFRAVRQLSAATTTGNPSNTTSPPPGRRWSTCPTGCSSRPPSTGSSRSGGKRSGTRWPGTAAPATPSRWAGSTSARSACATSCARAPACRRASAPRAPRCASARACA